MSSAVVKLKFRSLYLLNSVQSIWREWVSSVLTVFVIPFGTKGTRTRRERIGITSRKGRVKDLSVYVSH